MCYVDIIIKLKKSFELGSVQYAKNVTFWYNIYPAALRGVFIQLPTQ
jgi:hypothetical protein